MISVDLPDYEGLRIADGDLADWGDQLGARYLHVPLELDHDVDHLHFSDDCFVYAYEDLDFHLIFGGLFYLVGPLHREAF